MISKPTLPDISLLQWIHSLSPEVRHILLRRFIFMSSNNSDDFVLTANECDIYFQHLMDKPDFPLRRVACLLTVRSFFNFLLNQCHFNLLIEDVPAKVVSITSAHWLQAQQSWNVLCADTLSDAAVAQWLQVLQDQHHN